MAEKLSVNLTTAPSQQAVLEAKDTFEAIFAPLDALPEGPLTAEAVHELMELQKFHGGDELDLNMSLEEYQAWCATNRVVVIRTHHSNRSLLRAIRAEDEPPDPDGPGGSRLPMRRSQSEERAA